jgi:hypothetical protein
MRFFLIAVVTCAVAFYVRFLWEMQNDLRQRSKNRTDRRQPSPRVPLVKIDLAAVLAQTPSHASPGARKF